jgi:hypothetical protein
MMPSVLMEGALTTAFSLAFLADSNWYAEIDFTLAEVSMWGKMEGCEFL